MLMIARLAAFVLACITMSGVSTADELAPGNARSIHLDRFDGVVYYWIEQGNFRVVATLASGVDEAPIRFASTLGPDQRIVISVPRAVDQPSLDFEIWRDGEALLVNGPFSSPTVAVKD
jgi:hypothetical protein